MKNRPLMYVCLIILTGIIMAVFSCRRTSEKTLAAEDAGGGIGFLRELHSSSLEQRALQGDEVVAQGQVYRIEQKKEYQAVYLKNNSIRSVQDNQEDGQSLFHESRVITYIASDIQIQIGNKIRVQGEVSFFENARNPGNFDQKRYYQIQNIHGMIWGEKITVVDQTTWKMREWLRKFRGRWRETLEEVLGEEDGATLSAMMLGEKSEMDPELKSLYQANGIGHVLAISGLHLSFIGVGIYQLLRRMTGSYPAGGIAGIVFMTLYIMMIGLTVSALRAFVMFLFRVGADMTGRHYDMPTALAVAAVITLCWRPLYLFDGGFWLSYGAVLGILAVQPVLREYIQNIGTVGGILFRAFGASISIQTVLLPLTLYYFYEFPIYSFILNLFIIPLMSAILFLGILGSVWYASFLPGGELCLKACKGILWIYQKSCEVTIRLPEARFVAGKPEIRQIIVYYGILAMTLLFMGRIALRKKQKKREEGLKRECRETGKVRAGNERWQVRMEKCGVALLYTLAVFLLCCRFGEKDTLMTAVLDVGQGDGIYIRGPEGGTYLVDGGSSDVSKVGQYRIEPFLRSEGVRELDYVFVTHGDNDHISGISEMLERQDIGVRICTLVLPAREVWDEALEELARQAQTAGTKVVVMDAGQILTEGEMSIICLQPGTGTGRGEPDTSELPYGSGAGPGLGDTETEAEMQLEPGNAASMVLAVNFRAFDMLLTGDVEGEGEELLADELREQDSDRIWEVLKVAHHGSKNSSGEAFLDVVQPMYAVVSAGQQNRYGHPHQETLDRLSAAGSTVYSTQEGGAVIIEVQESSMKIHSWL